MKLKLPAIAVALCLFYGVNAQNGKAVLKTGKLVTNNSSVVIPEGNNLIAPPHRNCATGIPGAAWNSWFNQKVEELKANNQSAKTLTTTYVIPVIVHVIHGGQTIGNYPNITQAQIVSQIAILNNDYAGVGQNVSQLAATAFSAVGAATCGVSFCLAGKDTNGNILPEPGIDRVNYVTKGWANPVSFTNITNFRNFIDGTVKPNTIWNPTHYLNIWLTDVNNNVGLLGYATFPASSTLPGIPSVGGPNDDGIWVWPASFGNTGFAGPPYNLGRTATHEIGHWLGLRHIGGDGNNNPAGSCSATDYCSDTPPQLGGNAGGQYGQNFGGPSYPLHANNCSPNDPNGDMFMNFMDYSDDAYMYMFSPDQAFRIQTAMINCPYRNQMTSASSGLCGTRPSGDFAVASTDCVNTDVIANDQSTGNGTFTYAWSANPSTGVTFNTNSVANPTINFATVGTYTVRMIVTNNFSSDTVDKVVQVNACVGIKVNSILVKNIVLTPNPSTGIVNIVTSLPKSQTLEISVNNSLGQLINTSKHSGVTNNTFSIDLSNYSNGVYFVTINNGEEKIVKRLILNK